MPVDAAPEDVALHDFNSMGDDSMGFDDDPAAVSWYSDNEAIESI
jgi:hypothetical protein